MLVLEAAVEQEQTMHGVSKAQLAALREDNHRLRHQLHAIRRHSVVTGGALEPAKLVSIIHSSSTRLPSPNFSLHATICCGLRSTTSLTANRTSGI